MNVLVAAVEDHAPDDLFSWLIFFTLFATVGIFVVFIFTVKPPDPPNDPEDWEDDDADLYDGEDDEPSTYREPL